MPAAHARAIHGLRLVVWRRQLDRVRVAAELVGVRIPALVLEKQEVAARDVRAARIVVVGAELLAAAPAIPLLDALVELLAVRPQVCGGFIERGAGEQAEGGGECQSERADRSGHASRPEIEVKEEGQRSRAASLATMSIGLSRYSITVRRPWWISAMTAM